LKHSTEGQHDPKRSGLYEITPPEWEHAHLPSPMGNRDVPGKLWVPEPTIRQLLRLSKSTANRPAMCEAPVIHQSYTSGSSENLLEDLRCVLRDAREKAIREDDPVMLEYVKAMYSKLVA
ncbi:hypothetical protein VR45_34955, partial [Streptomyces sp. NRRL S-495]